MNTLILGIGNVLLKDEGVGVHALNALRDVPLPGDVEVLDGGTTGADLVDCIAGREKLIVIDATAADGEPGTVYKLTIDDLIRKTCSLGSLHEFGFVETYLTSKQLGCAPREVVIFGVQPADSEYGLDLSDAVQRQVPELLKLVVEEANRLV